MFSRSLCFSFTIVIALTLAFPSSSQEVSSSTYKFMYHGGPLLTEPNSINICIIWYGGFSQKDRTSINNFFAAFTTSRNPVPSVSTWWQTIHAYKDRAGKPVSSSVKLVKQVGDIYSLGKNLKRDQIANLVEANINTQKLPLDPNGIYLVLTAKDVTVERFCMGSCGFHDSLMVSKSSRVVYAHVGDSSMQCPGLCAWPYAVPVNGPPGKPLVSPNGVGVDGVVINVATILANAASNPFKTGYFQGAALAPLEAVTACPGIFGPGAYPGYAGNLKVDKISKASYNVYGANNSSKFLVPAIWDLKTSTCKTIA